MNIYDFTDKEVADFYLNAMHNVRDIRKQQGISQLDLAYLIGHKSVSTIAKIESGQENKHYNLEPLYKIAKVLDINICDLLKKS